MKGFPKHAGVSPFNQNDPPKEEKDKYPTRPLEPGEGDPKGGTINLPGRGSIIKGGKGIIQLGKKLLSKFGKKSTKTLPKPSTTTTLPKSKIPHYGDIKGSKDVDKVTNIIKQKGKLWDKAYAKNPKDFFTKDMFKEVQGFGGKGPGTRGYRRVIEMSKEGLPTQRMWQSTPLGGKKFASGKGTKDAFLPMEGFGNLKRFGKPDVKNWAIKGKGWDKGYGTKLYDKDFLGHYINKNLGK